MTTYKEIEALKELHKRLLFMEGSSINKKAIIKVLKSNQFKNIDTSVLMTYVFQVKDVQTLSNMVHNKIVMIESYLKLLNK